MILTVTLNAALDITYRVPGLRPGHAHRVGRVTARAGGKGINVARILHTLGEHVIVCGLAGGTTGAELTALLAAEAINTALTPITGQSRRTVVVHDSQGATGCIKDERLVAMPSRSAAARGLLAQGASHCDIAGKQVLPRVPANRKPGRVEELIGRDLDVAAVRMEPWAGVQLLAGGRPPK